MPKLKYTVAIPIKDYEDALKKVQKFVKRGFVDDVRWNSNTELLHGHNSCYVVVRATNGQVNIFSHSGCNTGAILKRVRDVGQHYVKD